MTTFPDIRSQADYPSYAAAAETLSSVFLGDDISYLAKDFSSRRLASIMGPVRAPASYRHSHLSSWISLDATTYPNLVHSRSLHCLAAHHFVLTSSVYSVVLHSHLPRPPLPKLSAVPFTANFVPRATHDRMSLTRTSLVMIINTKSD